MESNEIWDAEAARRYDTPEEGVFAPEVLEPTLHLLAEGGRVLEFAIGTGRVGVPVTMEAQATPGGHE